MKNTIILYHANCTDGFAAAFCAWLKYRDNAEYVPAKYGDDPPDVRGKRVHVLDFSYPREVLLEMHANADSLLVLDHHHTAKQALAGLPFAIFDMNRSGAGMAWDHLFGGERSQLIDYVEDRDLWRFELKNSREINAWLMSHEQDFTTWLELDAELFYRPYKCVTIGEALVRSVDQYVDSVRKFAIWYSVDDGTSVPVVNASYVHMSELLGALAGEAPFAVGWTLTGPDTVSYSLRSRGDYDVSELAKRYGGGGHKQAAGFRSRRMPHELWRLDEEP